MISICCDFVFTDLKGARAFQTLCRPSTLWTPCASRWDSPSEGCKKGFLVWISFRLKTFFSKSHVQIDFVTPPLCPPPLKGTPPNLVLTSETSLGTPLENF
eukprot:Pompholyxophrys_punicea_v1_NODE_531_length_1742_cov_4.785418.p3 type:complete len:101 gc:universal NODE_531_length_1742_cov_4.785418:359-57(-)